MVAEGHALRGERRGAGDTTYHREDRQTDDDRSALPEKFSTGDHGLSLVLPWFIS
jgi:hypothetical protein